VIPHSAGAHIGLQGGFAIADLPGLPGIVFLDSVADGQTIEDAAIVSQVTQQPGTSRLDDLPACQLAVPRAMCRTATVSSVISYSTRYRPARSLRRSGDPYGNDPAGRGSSASRSIVRNSAAFSVFL
jgi:hypothetical protein